MRLLMAVSALNLAPIFMGDTVQVFAMSRWGLSQQAVGQLLFVLALSGALANSMSGLLIRRLGLPVFTMLATFSALVLQIGFASASLRAALVCAGLGLLGPARILPATTLITTEGGRLGIPQGQLSGDRANLNAWIKVFGPLVYNSLYVQGAKAGVPTAPFALNVVLLLASLLLTPIALRAAGAGDDVTQPGRKSANKKGR